MSDDEADQMVTTGADTDAVIAEVVGMQLAEAGRGADLERLTELE